MEITGPNGVLELTKDGKSLILHDEGTLLFFNPVEDEDDKVVGFAVCCCGDEAVMALLEALTFATIEIAERCLTREEKEAPMKVDWPVTD